MLGAFGLLCVWLGVRIGRRRERAVRAGIDPNLHASLLAYARATLETSSLDVADMVVLPGRIRAAGEAALRTADEHAAAGLRRAHTQRHY